MSDKVTKALQKLSPKDRTIFTRILTDIIAGNLDTYDTKKLAGHDYLYRLRKGAYRIIFYKKDKDITIMDFSKRSDTTYREY